MLPAMKLIHALFVVTVLPLLLAGCGYGGRPLHIETLAAAKGKGDVGEIEPNFKQLYYRLDRDNNVYFYLKAIPGKNQQDVQQTVIFRIFWKPIGGRTTLNNAAINATFRYVVMNSAGAGSYEGAGFVRFYSKLGGKKLKARLIDGDLRLTEATSGFTDTLKRSRFRGTFTAIRDDARTVDLMLQTQRDFFARTFAASTQPATEPATPAAPEPAAGP